MISLRRPWIQEDQLVDLVPLIGITFLLLCFFLINLGFTGEGQIKVHRIGATAEGQGRKDAILIGISGAGTIHLDGRPLDLRAVQAAVSRMRLGRPEASVMLVAEASSRASLIARVIEECRRAGVREIGFSTRPEGTRHEG